jgi:hypothetical protein
VIIILLLALLYTNQITATTQFLSLTFYEQSTVIFSQTSSDPPIIGWSHSTANATCIPVIAWDGAYTGQTQEVWTWTYWVNDTDGVDAVLFRFRWNYDDEWFNRSAIRIAGNTNNGQYRGNLTWDVVWNWQNGSPEWVNGSGTFWFKVWANDTLGNWNETSPVHYMGGYLLVNPPLLHWVFLIGQLLIIPLIVIAILIIVSRKRKSS